MAGPAMTAEDRLLTEEEAKSIILEGWRDPEAKHSDIFWEPWIEALAQAQDAKTLRALRPVIEESAGRPCLREWRPELTGGGNPCGHCATCQARELLVEMDKDKEG